MIAVSPAYPSARRKVRFMLPILDNLPIDAL